MNLEVRKFTHRAKHFDADVLSQGTQGIDSVWIDDDMDAEIDAVLGMINDQLED